jgi:PAS domain S-box-containing protein
MVSERKYRSIFERSQDMILVSTQDGHVLELNPVGYRMLGIGDERDSLRELRFADFFADQSDWQKLLAAIDRQGFAASFEADLRSRDGRKVRALISATPGRESPGSGVTLHFMVKDIEKQRRMREQMAQADKLASIGELSAGIAHEINNPLGIILGYTQLLLRSEDLATERYNDLKTIEKHVRSCKSIVENLLSFARNAPAKMERVDIHEVIDDVLHFVQHHSKLDAVEIVTRYDTSAPGILLDERKIKQVLMNLLMNARHAVGKSGTIEIATRYDRQRNHILLSIADSGHGIEKKNLARIFDPFFTTKPTGEGTGLGLSVSYGIIKSHGGQIHVESTPGKGSVFTVDLPVAAANGGR